jgi:Flp pilus assembly protein TadG
VTPSSIQDRRRARDRGQSLLELALALPTFLLILFGMLEFGFVFMHNLGLEYATREGARSGSALVNGGKTLGCGTGQSPNAAIVDPLVIAAVQRVLTSPGTQVIESQVSEIDIYEAKADGTPNTPYVNVWTYTPGAGPVPQGAPATDKLDFSPQSVGWTVCSRQNVSPTPDSIGVSLKYTYKFVTPLASVLGFFGGGAATMQMADKSVMTMNPTN